MAIATMRCSEKPGLPPDTEMSKRQSVGIIELWRNLVGIRANHGNGELDGVGFALARIGAGAFSPRGDRIRRSNAGVGAGLTGLLALGVRSGLQAVAAIIPAFIA